VNIETAQQALELLEQAVATRGPDYRYPLRPAASGQSDACRYVWDGEPDCLVAVALSLAGWSVAELREIEAFGQIGNLPHPDARISWQAIEVLRCAQYAQDEGTSWGDALRSAREFADHL
jgi:hypothetical protein